MPPKTHKELKKADRLKKLHKVAWWEWFAWLYVIPPIIVGLFLGFLVFPIVVGFMGAMEVLEELQRALQEKSDARDRLTPPAERDARQGR
jgi:hypothetical protein